MATFLSPPPDVAPIVIYNDGGGVVDDYLRQARVYTVEGRRVEIRGSCRSACIVALSVPTVCVAPGAEVKAHQAYDKNTGKVMPEYTARLLEALPPAIQRRLEGHVQVNYTTDATLTYTQLVQLGVRPCKGPVPREQLPFTVAMKLRLQNWRLWP